MCLLSIKSTGCDVKNVKNVSNLVKCAITSNNNNLSLQNPKPNMNINQYKQYLQNHCWKKLYFNKNITATWKKKLNYFFEGFFLRFMFVWTLKSKGGLIPSRINFKPWLSYVSITYTLSQIQTRCKIGLDSKSSRNVNLLDNGSFQNIKPWCR